MHDKFNKIVGGQVVQIIRLKVYLTEKTVNLKVSLKTQSAISDITFINISSLSIDSLCFPCEFGGLIAICNKDKGWDDSMKYTLYDFEDGAIKFNCEEICFGATDTYCGGIYE